MSWSTPSKVVGWFSFFGRISSVAVGSAGAMEAVSVHFKMRVQLNCHEVLSLASFEFLHLNPSVSYYFKLM